VCYGNHSPLPSAEVKNVCSFTSALTICFDDMNMDRQTTVTKLNAWGLPNKIP